MAKPNYSFEKRQKEIAKKKKKEAKQLRKKNKNVTDGQDPLTQNVNTKNDGNE